MKNGNVALLQLCSGNNTKHNLAQIEQQIKQLPDTVKLVLTPENASLSRYWLPTHSVRFAKPRCT